MTKYPQLRDVWYAKLKKDGFKDIEDAEGRLYNWESHHNLTDNNDVYKQLKPALRSSQYQTMLAGREEYYRLAGHFLYDHAFANATERYIWQLHAEGMSYDTIITKVSIKKWRVKVIVPRLAKLMREKYI